MNALVLGSTGLVGGELYKLLAKDARFKEIHLLNRKEVQVVDQAKSWLVDFNHLDKLPALPKIDVLFIAFGTTAKDAGSQEAQRKVDLQIPADVMRLAKDHGVRSCVLVSSIGTNDSTRYFYLKLKAELEKIATELAFNQLVILRPSVLMGNRPQLRIGEKISGILGTLIGYTGLIDKYKPVQAKDVAKCMIEAKFLAPTGKYVIESDRIPYFASKSLIELP